MRLIRSSLFLLPLLAPPAFAEGKPAGKPPGKVTADAGTAGHKDSLDDVLQQAATAGDTPVEEAKPEPARPADKAPAARPEDKKPAQAATPAQPAQPAKPAEPTAPPTDDNDASAEAAAPTALAAVQQTGETRRRGPYELGPLDCRVLDGAGIERVLPKRIIAGEEPDILCRVIVTQPANVQTLEHDLTLTVNVGAKETFRQQRRVRISSVGRRALVFVVPADRISSDDPTKVKISAMLSAPATPGGGRQVQFTVESED